MSWIAENVEWLFGGAAVAVPLAVIGWLLAKPSKARRQSQRSGAHSTNVQSGRDTTIKGNRDKA